MYCFIVVMFIYTWNPLTDDHFVLRHFEPDRNRHPKGENIIDIPGIYINIFKKLE